MRNPGVRMEDEKYSNLFRAQRRMVRTGPKWVMARKFGVKWCSLVACCAKLLEGTGSLCVRRGSDSFPQCSYST